MHNKCLFFYLNKSLWLLSFTSRAASGVGLDTTFFCGDTDSWDEEHSVIGDGCYVSGMHGGSAIGVNFGSSFMLWGFR